MKTHRFGQKIRLHSTTAIKHQILTLMLEDEIRTPRGNSVFQPDASPAIAALKTLWGQNPALGRNVIPYEKVATSGGFRI
jgi:hypothetical protein